MPSSSAKKRRLRICEDSEEESSSSESDSDVEILRHQKSRSSSTPETKTALAKAAPSSASSGGSSSSSSFRLRRVPRGSTQKSTKTANEKKKPTKASPMTAATTSSKSNQATRVLKRPAGLSSLASLSSDSDSDSDVPTQSAKVRQRLDNKYRSSITVKNVSTKKVPAKKNSATAKQTTSFCFDSDSDSDSELIGVMDFDRKKKSPTTRQQTRQHKIAKRDHGIDPSLTATNNDDDSEDDSIVAPAACLTIVTKPITKKSPITTATATKKNATQGQKRKPPAQPKRNNGKSSRQFTASVRQTFEEDCSSDSSGESSNLRRIANKCATKGRSPPDRSPKSTFTMEIVDSDNDDDSVQQFGSSTKKPSRPRLAIETTTQKQFLESSSNNGDDSDATDELFQRLRTSQAIHPKALSPCIQKNESVAEGKATTTAHGNDNLGDSSSDDEWDLLPDKPRANKNDDDDDSIDTVELDRRLRLSLGLPTRKIEEPAKSVDEELMPVIPEKEKAAVQPSPHGPTRTRVAPGNQENVPANSHSNLQNNSSKQQVQPEEEFVLPDCDSSSSSSSSSTEVSKKDDHVTAQPENTYPAIPSEIGVQRSPRPKSKSSPAQPRNNDIPPFNNNNNNPYAHTAAPVNPYRRKYAAPTRTIASPTAAMGATSGRRLPSQPSPGEQFATGNTNHLHQVQQQQVQQQQAQEQQQEMQETQHHPSREELEEAFFDVGAASQQNYAHFSSTLDMSASRGMTSTTIDEYDQTPPQYDQQERPTEDLAEVFFDSSASSKAAPQRSPAVVNLCDDDDDTVDENVFFSEPSGPIVHQGLRVPKPSPGFNRRSREFGSRAHATDNTNNNGTDEITYFSDENREVSNRGRPRRVTDIMKNSVPTVSSAHYNPATTGLSRNAMASGNTRFSSSGFGQRQQVPFSRPELPRQWTQQPAKQQRIRDASKSNPFLARSVVARKPPAQRQQQSSTTGAILPTKDDNVYYRQGGSTEYTSSFNFATWQQSSSASQQPLRNDLSGGSGVGAGSYSVQYGGGEEIDAFEEEDDQHAPRASTRGRKKAASGRAKRPASKSKTGKTTKKGKSKSKGGWGRGKRGGWGGKRGGGGKYKRSGAGSRVGTPMESQSDAFLANVGGASITF